MTSKLLHVDAMHSLVALVVLTAAPDAALLVRLGEHADRTERFSKNASFTVDTIAEEYDSDGRVTKTSKSSTRVTRRDGVETKKLISYEEDGVDRTEKKRREVENAEPKPVNSPFVTSRQSKYRFEVLETTDEHVRIGFEPAGNRVPELITGEALVDPSTGEVHFTSMQPSKMPLFVDSLELTATFEGLAMSKFTLRGAAGFLFFKKRFGVSSTYRDYEVQPQ